MGGKEGGREGRWEERQILEGKLFTADSGAFSHFKISIFCHFYLADKARIQHATNQCPNHHKGLEVDASKMLSLKVDMEKC